MNSLKSGSSFIGPPVVLDAQVLNLTEALRGRPREPVGAVGVAVAESALGHDPAQHAANCTRSSAAYPRSSVAPQETRSAPADGSVARMSGSRYPAVANAARTDPATMSAPSAGTRAMAEPPNPPPVIRAPRAPAARAVAQARSSSGQDTS